MNAEQFGRWGEDIAAEYLSSAGYEVVERNWRCEYGEIDLIVCRNDAWVFVEIKARRSDSFGSPQEAVTRAKQRRLLDAAQVYLAEHDLEDVSWRVDVIAISVLEADYDNPQVDIYENAVGEW